MADDIFLSYNWGKDESGRDNKSRVSLVKKKLKELGYKTWFDEERVRGSITEKMSQGIEQSKGVIVFITRRYHEKVNGEDASDNCQLEFNYASRIKTRLKMVAVVMDKCMCDTKIWTGQIGLHLGGEKYVDMTGNFEDRTYLSNQIEVLQNELKSKGIVQLPGNLCSYFTFQCNGGENYKLYSSKYLIKHYEMIILSVLDDFFTWFCFISFTLFSEAFSKKMVMN